MKYAILFIALVILAYLVMDFNSRTTELNRLTAERELVDQQKSDRLQTQAALQTQIAYATSEGAALNYAYGNHMVRPGDVPIVAVGEAQPTPTPTPQPVVTPTPVSKLRQWYLLFFDPQEP